MTTLAAPLIDFRRPDPASLAMVVLGGAAAAVGLAVVFYMLATEGHASFNTSADVPWGLPIAYYLFFLLASSGLSIVASLDLIFGLEAFYPILKRCLWLAIATLVAGFTVLAFEIGHPFRMLWVLPLSVQIKSPMWWMGVFYTLDLVLLALKFYRVHVGDWHGRLSRWTGIAAFVTVIFASGTLGLVFGMMFMRPAWSNPIMPVYFTLSGFLSAIAFAVLFTDLARGNHVGAAARHMSEHLLPRLFMVGLLGVIAMTTGIIITGLWSNLEGLDPYWRLIGTPRFFMEVGVGLVIPLMLMATEDLRRRARVQETAAVLTLIGAFFSRYNQVLVGQEVPLFRGTWAEFAEYAPSFTEWMMVPMAAGLFLLVYGLGEWLLRLAESSEARSDERTPLRPSVTLGRAAE